MKLQRTCCLVSLPGKIRTVCVLNKTLHYESRVHQTSPELFRKRTAREKTWSKHGPNHHTVPSCSVQRRGRQCRADCKRPCAVLLSGYTLLSSFSLALARSSSSLTHLSVFFCTSSCTTGTPPPQTAIYRWRGLSSRARNVPVLACSPLLQLLALKQQIAKFGTVTLRNSDTSEQ
jgi:hypothetical protein